MKIKWFLVKTLSGLNRLTTILSILLVLEVLYGQSDILWHLQTGERWMQGWNMGVFEVGLEWVERIVKEVIG